MAEFFASSRVLIVAGKGGVGKSTLGATIGVSAARNGLDTLLVELEGHSSLGRPFGHGQLTAEGVDLPLPGSKGQLRAMRVTPDDALVEYLGEHGLDRVGSRLITSGAIDVVSTAAPGIRDLLALGKIRQLETAGVADLIVVDAPAAGHAMTFLRSPAGLRDSSVAGPVREQADAVLEMFSSEQRCQVVLVTLPEETPVSELIETAFDIEDTVGVKLGPLVMNGVWPDVDGLAAELDGAATPRSAIATARVDAARYRLGRTKAQLEQRERLADELSLPVVTLPYLFRPELDLAAIDDLSEQLCAELTRLAL
ncbi:MAG: arsenite-transporting ATPase [Acidimicrobiales bacterium]